MSYMKDVNRIHDTTPQKACISLLRMPVFKIPTMSRHTCIGSWEQRIKLKQEIAESFTTSTIYDMGQSHRISAFQNRLPAGNPVRRLRCKRQAYVIPPPILPSFLHSSVLIRDVFHTMVQLRICTDPVTDIVRLTDGRRVAFQPCASAARSRLTPMEASEFSPGTPSSCRLYPFYRVTCFLAPSDKSITYAFSQ